jgi:hypothetical protein
MQMGYAFVTLHSRWKMEVFASRHFQRDNPKHLASRDDISSKSSKALGVLRPSKLRKRESICRGGQPGRTCSCCRSCPDVQVAAAHSSRRPWMSKPPLRIGAPQSTPLSLADRSPTRNRALMHTTALMIYPT